MNQTETAYLVAYKFGERSVRGSSLSASKGIRIHLDHATANSGHVLFTVGRFPAPSEQDKIRRLMMTTRDGVMPFLLMSMISVLKKLPRPRAIPFLLSGKTKIRLQSRDGSLSLTLLHVRSNLACLHLGLEMTFWSAFVGMDL